MNNILYFRKYYQHINAADKDFAEQNITYNFIQQSKVYLSKPPVNTQVKPVGISSCYANNLVLLTNSPRFLSLGEYFYSILQTFSSFIRMSHHAS